MKIRLMKTLQYVALLITSLSLYIQAHAQPCVSQSAPTPQMGAHINPQFVNLWKQASVNDKHGDGFRKGAASIGDDGWLVDNHNHNLRFYYQDVLPRIVKDNIIKVKFRGTIDQVGSGIEDCTVQNIQTSGGFTTFEVKINSGINKNGWVFQLKNRCTDIQIVRPGYDFDDPRLLTDEYVQHTKYWTAFRFMGLLSAPSNFGQTWAKRVSPNAPMNINTFQWSAPDCNNLQPQFPKFSEDVVPFTRSDGRTDGMWAPGAPWEMVIDISNYLNKDMWITIPTMANDEYVRNLSKLIKERLKPTLNVHVEIGNELWNTGPPFMGFYMVRQILEQEWNEKNPEKLKILGGSYCQGCELQASDANVDRTACKYEDYTAMQRWMARRLKEMMEQFALDWGWKDQGGVGSRIRATLAGQIGYAWEGHAWNIRAGLEFLMKAYGPDAPSKYLYSVSVAAYFLPGSNAPFNRSASVDEIATNYQNYPMNYIFGDYATEVWGPNVRVGNKAEGVFGLARLCGLKMYAYEGGNELGNGGDGSANGWVTYDNAPAAFKDSRVGNANTELLNEWFSWFGYDALFMKNGDYVGTISAYSMSETLNEENAMRQSYLKVANSAAPLLSKKRGGVIGIPAVTVLDARKTSSYMENWEKGAHNIWHKKYTTEANPDFTLKSNDNWSAPMIIRCEKTGVYKLELERTQMGGGSTANKTDDDKFPTYCDIFLNEKLIKSGVRFNLATFSRKTTDQVNQPNYWWTEPVEIEIPYGVHALRVRPSLPTATRLGNLPAVYNGDMNRRFVNQIELLSYRFTLSSELPPVQPKEVIGDLEVCKGNNRARYEVGENDASACTYEWAGLPTTAKIQPAEQVPGSSPARYSSGASTYKIFVDWGTTAPGTYNLSVVAKNEKGDGTPQASIERTFKVIIKNCGFEFAPNPVCLGREVLFTPVPLADAKEYVWDNGKFGQSNSQRFFVSTSSAVYKTSYDVPGVYDVSLQVNDNSGKQFFFSNRLVAVSCNTPTVKSPLILCKGATATPVTAEVSSGGSDLKWYSTATGGTALSSAPTPSTATSDTLYYWVSQQNATGESERTKLEVFINDIPPMPAVSNPNPLMYCTNSNAQVSDLTSKVTRATDATLKWYNTATSTTSMENPTAPSTATVSSKSWFVSQAIGTCESPKAELKVEVKNGPQYSVVPENPATCGAKGYLVFRELTANGNFQIAYNSELPKSFTSDDQGEIKVEVNQGNYSNFKVSQDGCTTSKSEAVTITEPAAPSYNIVERQPKECGAQGALVLKGLMPNKTYLVRYNDVADKSYVSTEDSIEIKLPKGEYKSFNVSIAGCSKSDAGTYTLTEPVIVPPVVMSGIPNYCQNQVVNIEDITSKVSREEGYQLKWYETLNGAPANEPEPISTTTAGVQSKWVSQANESGCESEKREVRIQITESTTLSVTKEDPTSCTIANGKLIISNLKNVVEYNVDFMKEGKSQATLKTYSGTDGRIIIDGLTGGRYSSITATPVQGNSCATNSDNIVELMNPNAPTAAPAVSGGGEFCEGSPVPPINASITGNAEDIEWYTDASLQTKDGSGVSYIPKISSGSATIYVLENKNGCKGPAGQATVTGIKTPKVAPISGSGGPATCNGTSYPLTLRSEVGVVYTVLKDDISTTLVQNGTGADISFEVYEEGTYTVKAESGTLKCPASMTGTLKIEPFGGPQSFNVSGNATGCAGTVPPVAITLDGSQLNVEYKIRNTTQTKAGTGSSINFSMEAIVANNGTYYIDATDLQTGCTSEMKGSATIAIQESLNQPTLQGSANYCNKTIAQISVANLSSGATQKWSISQGSGLIDNMGNVTWNKNYTGTATITLELSSPQCANDKKIASFTTNVSSTPIASPIVGDSLVCRGNVKLYKVTPLADVTYEWSISTNASLNPEDASKSGVTVTYNIDIPQEGIALTVTPVSQTCGAGLPVKKIITKNSGCDLYVPNVFTPSSSDSYSEWNIAGMENYPNMSVKIFNRWGGQVFSQNNGYRSKWDGTMDGKPLPTATYFYVIDKKDGTDIVTGSVTIVRE